MTEHPGLRALREPGLAAHDRAGLLPAVAAAGAQVRSVAAAAAELPALDRPRAMVVIGADASADVEFLTASIGRTAPAPVVAAQTLPPWVGALDLIVVLANRPDDDAAAEAAGVARRRGATVVVRGAEQGPVADAAGRSLFAPVVAVPEALATSARWALLALVAARAGLGPQVELARTADLLDATALACHPDAETFLNPGVNLAEYLGEGTGLLIGCDRVADAIAGHGVRVLAELAGVAASRMTAAQAAGSPALLRRVGGPKDLFADPFDDQEPGQLVKPLLVSSTPEDASAAGRSPQAQHGAADRLVLSAMRRAFPGSMHLDGSSDSLPAVAGLPEWSGSRESDLTAGGSLAPSPAPADGFDAAVAATVRLDFAAVYLGLATGQLVPLDFPDGLGRAGGTRWAVRAATVGDGREREQGLSRWN